MTVIHGDAHVWKVFLAHAGGNDVRRFDRDRWRIGVGTDDFAYKMGITLIPRSQAYEGHLLDHPTLSSSRIGSQVDNWHALDDDYLLSVLWQIATPYAGSQ